MIDKTMRKATVEHTRSMVIVRMTGGPDCLWLNMYLDVTDWIMTCTSDIGFYSYRWGKWASKTELFIEFCCRWLDDEHWLLRKCIDEQHVCKRFLRERAEAAVRQMVLEYNSDDEDFDPDALDDVLCEAAGYGEDAQAWGVALQNAAEYNHVDLPEEWYVCIEYDYTPFQKRFAEICREVIVPLLKQLVQGEYRLLEDE